MKKTNQSQQTIYRKTLQENISNQFRVSRNALCRFTIVLLLLITITRPCPGQTTHTIPFHVVYKLIIVQGEINGIPGYLIVDTGIRGSVLSKRYFESTSRGQEYLSTDGTCIPTKNGDAIVRMGNLTEHYQNSPIICTEHLIPQPTLAVLGIVGWDFFSDGSLTVDFATKELLYSVDENNNQPDRSGIFLDVSSGLPVIEAQVNKRKHKYILDTGASCSVVDLNLKKQINITGQQKLRQWHSQTCKVWSGVLQGFQINQLHLDSLPVLCYDLSDLNHSLEHVYISGILGRNLFEQYKVTLDFANARVHLENYFSDYMVAQK